MESIDSMNELQMPCIYHLGDHSFNTGKNKEFAEMRLVILDRNHALFTIH